MLAENFNMVKVIAFQQVMQQRWDSYVEQHGEGTFFHLCGWQQVLRASFNHKNHSIVAVIDGAIVGILPLVEVKSHLFAHALISTPFCVYGGALADNQQIHRLLEQRAMELAERLQVDYLELRYKSKQQSSLQLVQHHSTFDCPIAANPEQILASIKKKQRAVIRHSLNNQLSFGKTDLKQFYHLFSLSYRNLGTPVMSRKYFHQLAEVFAERSVIHAVFDQSQKGQSSVLSFYFKDQVIPYYAGASTDAKRNKSMDFIYYQLMCEAAGLGVKSFDFGRSKNNSGAYQYKKHWGIEPQPLYYYYHLVKSKQLPNLSPNNPKYKLLVKLWQLLPLPLSRLLGPFLAKSLG
ncbi:FemAB family XrtA/PEP-CTERM system-associated protein [Thalassotalea sp. ND16A]|uniref:FemAB family XrtA/PEP-CTERM system-associated protein n=1 Tax=Thalassotalea sp. ND16A TaxID=1535422 RepID=UPI00051D5249|nr:FemAB family XrtA/PEP-CTERM system-associated protein [Thalassotalea sp. ND16A]KGJ95962.1 hypothetical protein ND16A_1141 [Thalassotalea sp. ND16A]